jgi:hypothetical protein
MECNMRKSTMLFGAVIIVGILGFVYLMPGNGVKGDEPQAEITVFITDLTTGEQASALVTVGEPSGLSFVKQKVEFKPLATWEGTQDIQIYPSHKYAIRAQVTFRYTGTNIGSYTSARASFDATPSQTNYVMITQTQFSSMGGQLLTNDLCRLTIPQSSGLTSPMTLSMTTTDIWVYQATINSASWKTPSPSTTSWDYLTGLNLAGVTINCKVIVSGTSAQGIPATAEVTAKLYIRTAFLTETGSISLTVDSMSAGVL